MDTTEAWGQVVNAGFAGALLHPGNRRLLAVVCAAHLTLIVAPILKFGWVGPLIVVVTVFSLAAVFGSTTTALFYLGTVPVMLPRAFFDEYLRLPGNLHFVEALYILIVVLATLGWLSSRRRIWPRTPLDFPVAVFLGLVIFSCGLGLAYGQSTSHMLRNVRYPLYYGLFFVATGFLDVRRFSSWIPLLVGTSAIVGVEYLFEFLGVVNLSISGSFVRVARVEGLMLPIGTLLVATVWMFEQRPYRRVLSGIALVPMALALVLTVGRGMWIGTGVGLIVLALLVLLDRNRPGRSRRFVMLVAMPALIFGMGYVFETVTSAGVTGAAYRKIERAVNQEDWTISSRLISYGLVLEAMQERPLLGGGHGATVSIPILDAVVPHILTTGAVDNLYLTLGLRMGLIGIGVFVWLYWKALRLAFKRFREDASPDHRLLLAAFMTVYCGLLVYGMADATMITNRIAFVHAVFLAMVGRLAAESTAVGPGLTHTKPPAAPSLEGAETATVSAVIVNWNCGAHLLRCVDAVGKSRSVAIAEILVVDNASSDGSLATVQEVERVRVIQTGSNLGYGGGANRGIREAKSEYVVILNPDVVLDEDAIGQMATYLGSELECGLVGPRLLDGKGTEPGSCGHRPVLWDAIGRKFLLHLIFPIFNFRLLRPDFPAEVGWVTGACTVARRSALNSVGGFDEAIFMYFEDLDLSERLREAGWKVCFLPTAVGRHAGGESSRQVLDRMLLASEVSYRYFTRKHFGAFWAGLLTLLTPVEMILRSALWSSIYVCSSRRRREAVTRLRAYWKTFLNNFEGAAPPDAPSAVPGATRETLT